MAFHNPYSNHYFQVPHPRTPYHGDIPNGMVPGKTVFIKGQVTGQDFEINFATHHGIAFHFNPRLHMHRVVRNAKMHGSWGPEEIDGPMPFHHHQHFEIVFKCEHGKFLVAVNGQHCYEFNHRQAVYDISHLEVKGAFCVDSIVFSGGQGDSKGNHVPTRVPSAIPIHHAHAGNMIRIQSDVLPHTSRFVINLESGGGDSQEMKKRRRKKGKNMLIIKQQLN